MACVRPSASTSCVRRAGARESVLDNSFPRISPQRLVRPVLSEIEARLAETKDFGSRATRFCLLYNWLWKSGNLRGMSMSDTENRCASWRVRGQQPDTTPSVILGKWGIHLYK